MKILKRLLPFAVVIAVALLLVYLPDVVPERYTDLSSYFGNERLRQGLVGYTVASVRYGKPDLAEAWGTDARGVPLESFTPMAIGELSAAVTGLLVLQAESEGRLQLDHPLSEYLPSLGFRQPTPSSSRSAAGPTIRTLLTHTSGIDEGDFDDRHPAAKDLEAGVRALMRVGPSDDQGGNFNYIETGYQALALALQAAYKKPFSELAATKVFKPLKMIQTDAVGGESVNRLPLGSTAFYWTAVPKSQDLPLYRVASSGIVSTAPDFARLMAAIVSPGFGGASIAPPSALAKLLAPLAPHGGFSYGWRIRDTKQGKELRIEAATEAFASIAVIWPERQAGIVILSPESSFFISRISLPMMAEGAGEILLSDATLPPLPFGRFFILFAVVASVHIIFISTQTGNALSWARGARGRADAAGHSRPIQFARIRCLVGIVLRLALILSTPFLASLLLGRQVDWSLLFDREPSIAGWLIVASSVAILRNVARLSWLRGPSSQFRKMRLLLRK